MKAILNEDKILKLSTTKGIEIGDIPEGAGLERLRWDGIFLIDLTDLDEIWVEFKNGMFHLHATPLPYSQLVEMQYKDRKKLYVDKDGMIKIQE